jgi:hypothetical protein
MALAIFRPEQTEDFETEFTANSGATIQPVIDFEYLTRTIITPKGFEPATCFACRVIFLQGHYILPSLRGVNPPNIYPEDGEAEIAQKIQSNLEVAPSRTIGLYKRKVTESWRQIAQIELQNHGKLNVGVWGYRPLQNPLIDNGTGFFSHDSQIGASIINKGSGTLQGDDKFIVIGSALIIPSFVETPAVSDTNLTFSGGQSFSRDVQNSSAVQIVENNPNRKELRLTTNRKIWFRFSNSGAGVSKGACAFIDAGGSLTYENGRLAFEGGRGELIAQRWTQSFGLWAIADNEPATVSGEEFW